MKSKIAYHILSWTWGLPMTLIGYIVALVLRLMGYTPFKWGGSTYFMVGKNWGGVELGQIFVVDDSPTEYILNHEFGHSIQNCYFGFLFPFIVAIPSAVRYWYRRAVVKFGIKAQDELPGYYDIWFEKQASELGQTSISYWK